MSNIVDKFIVLASDLKSIIDLAEAVKKDLIQSGGSALMGDGIVANFIHLVHTKLNQTPYIEPASEPAAENNA